MDLGVRRYGRKIRCTRIASREHSRAGSSCGTPTEVSAPAGDLPLDDLDHTVWRRIPDPTGFFLPSRRLRGGNDWHEKFGIHSVYADAGGRAGQGVRTVAQGLVGATFWDEDEMTFRQAGRGAVAESDL